MYYGWYIVAGVFLSQLFQAGFFIYSFSLLVLPIQTSFDASRAEVMLSMSGATIMGLIASPFVGRMVDRYPARWLLSSGAMIYAIGLLLLSGAQTVTQFAILFSLFICIGNLLLGPLTASATVSRWFTESRGKALGVAAVGTSVGGVLIPALIAYWLVDVGWRGSLQNLAYCVLLLVLPYMLVVIRAPETQVEGGEQGASTQSPSVDLTMKTIILERAYWVIGISMGLLFCVYSAVLANLSPYAVGLGATESAAARLIMVLAVSGLIGKLVFGIAADKIDLRSALWIAQGLVVVGVMLFSSEPSYPLMMLASVLLGLATGGMLPVWGAMLAVQFGVASYGRAMGLMNPLIVLMIMPGYAVTGYLYDMSGNYQLAFSLCGGLAILSAVILLAMRKNSPAVDAEAS